MKRGKRERAYEELIVPLMREVMRISGEHDLPFMVTFQLTRPRPDHAAGLGSWWSLPHWSCPTLRDMRERAVPDWAEIEAARRLE